MMTICPNCEQENTRSQMIVNREQRMLLCWMCGAGLIDLQKEESDRLDKLQADYRGWAKMQSFQVIETPSRLHAEQYFILFGHSDGEAYNPENIRGVENVSMVATIMSAFRETGVLKIPKSRPDLGGRIDYEYIPAMWMYVLKSEHMMYKRMTSVDIPLPKDTI